MGRRQASATAATAAAAAAAAGGGGRADTSNIPCAESLIGRLDQLDHRLRQLEEKQMRPHMYFPAAEDLRSSTKAPTNECNPLQLHQQVQLKGNLMDRLHLLETRIRQLSCELERGNISDAAGSLTTATTRTATTIQQEEVGEEAKKKKQNNTGSRVVGAPFAWRTGEIFHKGARELQAHKSKTKAKEDSKELPVDAAMKSAVCRDDDKRRMERTRFYKRWFPVGC